MCVCDPLPQKGYKVAGTDTSYRQRSEATTRVLDSHTLRQLARLSFLIFRDTDGLELNIKLYCVLCASFLLCQYLTRDQIDLRPFS